MLQPLPQVLSYAQAQPLGCVTADELLDLQRVFQTRYPVLLQSAAAVRGNQHDVLMALPQQTLTLLSSGRLETPEVIADDVDASFLEALDQWWQREKMPVQSSTLPFSGGWFLFLGYELAADIEPALNSLMNDNNTHPGDIVAQAVRVPAAIVRDAATHEAWFVAEHEYVPQFDMVNTDLDKVRSLSASSPLHNMVTELHEESPQFFLAAVDHALEYIAAGDIYQANLSRGWNAIVRAGVSAQHIYQQLCAANPAPFAGIALLRDNEAIISSSPERLISIKQGEVSTRPIAGTRPRSSDQQRDAQLIDELRGNTKEQAEHVMLLDLERNDLGKICEAGSVHVDEFMTVESYVHVHHIVSNVHGQLRKEVTPSQAIAAVFPGGTITGCPKIRCMQVIAELERVRRGAYTGSMGYLNRDGSMDLNILIRSLHLQGHSLSFRAGAGIVADSIGGRELEETRAKALGLLRALGVSC